MEEQQLEIEYAKPMQLQAGELWARRRTLEVAAVICLTFALMLGGITFMASQKMATQTPEYRAFLTQKFSDQSAPSAAEEFNGVRMNQVSMLRFPTTYLAIGLAAAGVSLFIWMLRVDTAMKHP